jgi:SAM-dependent methyltransferase
MSNDPMWSENQLKNEKYYDTLYASVKVDSVLNKLQHLDTFFPDAIRTYTSWAGFYYGDFAAEIKGKRVLELGCGDCLNAAIMAAMGAEVVANDISSESGRIIEGLNASYPFSKPLEFIYGDFLQADIPANSFDVVTGKNFIHHLTHEQELAFTEKIIRILKSGGVVRYFEPAENWKLLDDIRWLVPVPGRPSKFQQKKFAEFKKSDPHPVRDNSYKHYLEIGKKFFHQTEVVPIGGIERFNRIIPLGKFNLRFRRFAFRFEKLLPQGFHLRIARSQTITYREPRK